MSKRFMVYPLRVPILDQHAVPAPNLAQHAHGTATERAPSITVTSRHVTPPRTCCRTFPRSVTISGERRSLFPARRCAPHILRRWDAILFSLRDGRPTAYTYERASMI